MHLASFSSRMPSSEKLNFLACRISVWHNAVDAISRCVLSPPQGEVNSVKFGYTETIEAYEVPASGRYRVRACGAKAANGKVYKGGRGGDIYTLQLIESPSPSCLLFVAFWFIE